MDTRARRRNRFARAVQERVAGLTAPWLPMPYVESSAKLGFDEWLEYRERRARHLALCPDYDAGWKRPTPQTAEAVWDLLAPALNIKLEDLFPPFPPVRDLLPDERHERAVTAKQALLVVLDRLVRAGRQRRTLTLNPVFDALAVRWSDHFRRARKESGAFQVRDMKLETAKASRRDLLRAEIRLDALWRVAVGRWSAEDGGNPLYYVKQLLYGGYQVFLKEPSRELDQFERLVRSDPSYRPHDSGWRLLRAEAPLPPREPRQEVCAERAYNVVCLGPRSERLLDAQAQVHLMFNAEAFRDDYLTAEQAADAIRQKLREGYGVDPDASDRPPTPRQRGVKRYLPSPRQWQLSRVPKDRRDTVRGLVEKYDRARGLTANFRGLWEQLTPPAGGAWWVLVKEALDRFEAGDHAGLRPSWLFIRSGFIRLINRRYQPTHIWPPSVSSRSLDEKWYMPMRQRWFSLDLIRPHLDPRHREYRTWKLVGVDVSSSQTQILAVLLGLEKLHTHASSSEKPFKKYLAELAWRKNKDPNDPFTLRGGYEGATDERLIELVKWLWMRALYGSPVWQVVQDQREEPSVYGPGWTAKNAMRFLTSLPWYEDVGHFLNACRRLVKHACQDDPYRGVVFTDPFDGAEVRWNPVQRAEVPLPSAGQKLFLSLPGKEVGPAGGPTVFRPAVANAKGDYPVDRRELGKMVAPCLIHTLDAFFSSLVLERLIAGGVQDVVGIHDAWYLLVGHEEEGSALTRLDDAIRGASEEWLKGLKPVYDLLAAYLGTDREYGPLIRKWQAQWENRVRDGRWPQFATSVHVEGLL